MSKSILVVDDEFAIYQMISTFLLAKGYETLWAKNGLEGYEKFMEELPEMLLVDVLMPKMSGPDMVKKIRGRIEGKKVPILMMTSIEKSFRLKSDATFKWGANGYLQKPFDLDTLHKMVREQIGEGKTKGAKVVKEKTMPADKAVHGRFSDRSYAKVLHLLYKRQATGRLELTGDRKRIAVYFESGRPVDVRSNYIQDRSLTRFLQAMLPLSDEKIIESRKIMEKKGLMQGEAFMEMGAISIDDLNGALRLQSEEKLLTPFGWDEGTYAFVAGLMVHDPALLISKPLANLVLTGVSRYYTPERIEKSFAGKMRQSIKFNYDSPYNVEDFGLDMEERSLAQSAIAKKSLADIFDHSSISRSRAHTIIYTMFLIGMLKFAPEKRTPEPKVKSGAEKITVHVSHDDCDRCEELGLVALKSKDYQAAAGHFQKAMDINNRVPRFFAHLALAVFRMPESTRGDYPDPALLLKRALKLDPDNVPAIFNMGLILKEQKDFSGAQRYFRRVVQLDPAHPEVKRELQLVEIRLRKDSLL